jgi:hypothetical protein
MFAGVILVSVCMIEGEGGFVLLFPFWCVFISQGILFVLEAIKSKWRK